MNITLNAQAIRGRGVRVVFSAVEHRDAPLIRAFEGAAVPVVETLHEQTAAFAAEGWAKLTREPGVVMLIGALALPRAITGLANAFANESPVVVVHDPVTVPGRDDAGGQHLTMVSSISRGTWTTTTAELPNAISRAWDVANTPPRGPVFIGIRADAPTRVTEVDTARRKESDGETLREVASLLAGAVRPVLVAGGGVYWSGAEAALKRFAEGLGVPVATNGMGRGTMPADHPLYIARARSLALREADLVLVVGTPLDFRLGYGRFERAAVVHICEDDSQLAGHVQLAGALVGDHGRLLDGLVGSIGHALGTEDWIKRLRDEEASRRAAEDVELESDASPIRPPRLYGELRKRLNRDAVVIGDGGDFVSYAGRFIDTYTPGCFLDPGPFGCLGIGMGYAMAARLAHPARQIVALFGDGAAGLSLMELSTLVRHGLPIVAIIGNNSGWGLEKHEMKGMFGYDVVADLRPGTRYDEVAEALGAKGETVTEPEEIGAALDRAFDAGGPVVVNVMLDPTDAYPRSTILA